jgi:hypothetical protein
VKVLRYLVIPLALAMVWASTWALNGAAPASASTARHRPWVCRGTLNRPGVLTGIHANVVIIGACKVSAGRALVRGNLTLTSGATLVAVFARNHRTHRGRSKLAVSGNLTVLPGATAILGCEAPESPCIDDPHPRHPTLSSSTAVSGNLLAIESLGIVIHDSVIDGNVLQFGGGGGRKCAPRGIFKLFQAPVYSDYEDNLIGGNLSVSGVRSCWFGALRNAIHGNVAVAANRMADPDANEVLTNVVHGNIACFANHPAVQFGDSHGSPNVVTGFAAGQCGFGVLKPNPAPSGPLTHISVPAR